MMTEKKYNYHENNLIQVEVKREVYGNFIYLFCILKKRAVNVR